MDNNESETPGQGELFEEKKESKDKNQLKGGYLPDIKRYSRRGKKHVSQPPDNSNK